ncbi:Zn-dependent protease [Anaerobacterium chartisolvens]|uniref:Zn-dependent protease n=1 Tax=Anaerobacterium chartisolvens TaxID=1297424 RepID=A0A369B731_9FIRM|nr:site-2 protease family protein [Anaerobacterium chartisolvens]RCX16356.1 Zn-dependent protease [Anaerobacterium chartisolvens]
MFNLDPVRILMALPAVLIGLSFHEFAHAFASDRLGDPTPRNQGRLTLSPLPHIDIIGLILIALAGFGWAKPVQVNTSYYKNPKRDDIIVSLAGPFMNLVLAFVFTVLFKVAIDFNASSYTGGGLYDIILNMLYYAIQINIMLFVFNLIPIPPLDGFHVLSNVISARGYRLIYTLQQYGSIILILIVVTPVSRYIISPPIKFLLNGMLSLMGIV